MANTGDGEHLCTTVADIRNGKGSEENNSRIGRTREVISSATVCAFHCIQDNKTSAGHIVLMM